jgi:large subunit ribosomal protein L21
VTAVVQEQGKGRKVGIVKFRRRKGYKRMKGHRQPYTRIQVTGITG